MRKLSAQTKQKISMALRGKLKAGKLGAKKLKVMGKRSAGNTPAQQPKGISLKESEGFTGYRTGTSTKKPMTQGAGKTSKGYGGGQQSAKAMQDSTGGFTGYRTQSQQKKASKQGEYKKNLDRFMGGK